MASKSNPIRMNPLVQELLETKSKPVELAGYVGPSSETGWIRLYRDMGLETYTEIPEDAVIRFRESDDAEGRTTLFFDGSVEVRFVTVTTLRLQDPARRPVGCGGCGSQRMALRRADDGGGGGNGPDCAATCEGARLVCEELANMRGDEETKASDLAWCQAAYEQCIKNCRTTRPGGVFGDVVV